MRLMARSEAADERGRARWLTRDQELAWRSVASMVHRLRWALECQLERDSDLSFIEYHALARLSEEPDHRLRMSDLAAVTDASLSRLSHLIKRLESWGFVRREPDSDRRTVHDRHPHRRGLRKTRRQRPRSRRLRPAARHR